MKKKYRYYKNLKTRSIYRTEEIVLNNGEESISLNRWNWDFQNWNGHIHHYKKTREQIEAGIVIVPITKEEAMDLIDS